MRRYRKKKKEGILASLFIISIICVILLPLALLILTAYLLIRHFKKRDEKIYLEDVEKMSPYEFEYFIARIFKKIGYKTKVTKASGDFGVDVIAKNENEVIAIQVKKFKNHSVGNRDVQMLLGAMQMNKYRADRSIIITTSNFTKNAIEQAKGCPVELWNRKKLIKVIKNLS